MPPRYSEREARDAVARSRSYAEALRNLGACQTGGAAAVLKRYVAEVWHIPVDHFDPAAARREALARANRPLPLQQVLVAGRAYSRGTLKNRLYAEGLKTPRCELCGQGETWRGKPMSLILDHVNGVSDDNRLENLRIVCPNCAATLDTHCGRNKRRLPAEAMCARCERPFRPRYTNHRYCSTECGRRHDNRPQSGVPVPYRRKVQRPPLEQLRAEVEADGFVATGRRYGVSDNAIRKWIRQYEREAAAEAQAAAAGPLATDGEGTPVPGREAGDPPKPS